jgi:NDP-sugar pyrophosphorylase family protein
MNGDSYIDVDLAGYVSWFFENNCQASIVLARADDTSRYGSVCIYGNRITAFREKQTGSEAGWVNAGIYLISKPLILSMPAGEFYSLEHQFFPKLITQKLFGFCVGSRLIDIGTPDSYAAAQVFCFDKLPDISDKPDIFEQ